MTPVWQREINVKQRPQPTRMACRRADFSRPWRVETRPTQSTRVSCFGVSLLNMDVRATQAVDVQQQVAVEGGGHAQRIVLSSLQADFFMQAHCPRPFNLSESIPRPLGRYLEAMQSEPCGCCAFGCLSP